MKEMSQADSIKYKIEAEGDKGVIQQVSYLISFNFYRFLVASETLLTWMMRLLQRWSDSRKIRNKEPNRIRRSLIDGIQRRSMKNTSWRATCLIMKRSRKDSFSVSKSTLTQSTEESSQNKIDVRDMASWFIEKTGCMKDTGSTTKGKKKATRDIQMATDTKAISNLEKLMEKVSITGPMVRSMTASGPVV